MTPPPDERSRESVYPGAPLWVKLFVLALVALIIIFVIATLLGSHQPMPHTR